MYKSTFSDSWVSSGDYAIFGVGCMLQFAVKISGMTMSNLLLHSTQKLPFIGISKASAPYNWLSPTHRSIFYLKLGRGCVRLSLMDYKRENFPNGKTLAGLPFGRNNFRLVLFGVGLFTFSVPNWNFTSWHLSLFVMLVDIEVALWFSSVQIRLSSFQKKCVNLKSEYKTIFEISVSMHHFPIKPLAERFLPKLYHINSDFYPSFMTSNFAVHDSLENHSKTLTWKSVVLLWQLKNSNQLLDN